MSEPIVVIGDVLLDVDVEARAERLMPEAPVPVLEEHGRTYRAGGAALAATLLARSSARPVLLVAGLPDGDAAARVRELLPAAVTVLRVPSHGEVPVKTRLRAGGQTVARLDMRGAPLRYEALPTECRDAVHEAAAVLVSDYGGGATHTPSLREALQARATRRPTVWDPHPRGGAPVPGASLVTPNAREAAAASGTAGDAIGARRQQAERLRRRWSARAVAITLGADGALLSYGDGAVELFPTRPRHGGDTCGAGDCFAAAAVAAMAEQALPSEAVAAAVEAASRFVAAGGAAAMDRACDAPMPASRTAAAVVADVRTRGGTVVATGGCFDLLHAGHVATLAAARSLGDCLVVCINSDDSVRRLKGISRPLQSATDRARVLSSLRDVDAVLVFDEDTPEHALRTLRPDIWVKGGDYAGGELPEASLVRSWGGEVVTVPYLAGRSTSQLVDLARQ
ncbi:MAG TPA: D-glycero-beta-D-manno-heptose 1-phosphate adenylyltransferase [Jatrophihabitans sp.]|nr:D-glycero-beta-D-manno-heptose 1-phosphate adenylyltransferase [Jatrophihabitans sp.]